MIHAFTPLTPRWLYSKGYVKEARANLKNIGSKSKIELSDEFLEKIEAESENQSKARTYTSLDLLKWPKMRLITLNCGYCWFVTSMVYYGLGLNAGALAGNIFVNNVVNAVVEILARFLIPFLMGMFFLLF